MSQRISRSLRTVPLIALLLFLSQAQGDLEIDRHVIANGGGASAGGGFELIGTIGQAEAGTSNGNTFELVGGFLPGPSEPPCLGDSNGSGTVDVDDLISVILDWNTDGTANNGDVNGSGIVDVDDLVDVILAWGPCPE